MHTALDIARRYEEEPHLSVEAAEVAVVDVEQEGA